MLTEYANTPNTKRMTTTKQEQPPHYLDTLETTSDSFLSKSHETLYRTALRKNATQQKVKLLVDATTEKEWKSRYWDTYHCNNILLQDGSQLIGSLCRRRWCQNCNRIKTAEMVNAYKQPLTELNDLYFVTLTAPTVKGRQLSSELNKRLKAFQRAKDNLRKTYGIKLVGMRKTEITYNEKEDKYHPHFHFIQQGKVEAEALLNEWLKQFPNASINAQDIQRIDTTNDNSFIELFKYATKDVVKDSTTAEAQHTIYKALHTRRIFQTYGSLKKVEEPMEAKEVTEMADFLPYAMEIWKYETHFKDWLNAKNELMVGVKHIEPMIT